MTKLAIRIIAILGALILLVTVGFHMTALPQFETALEGLELGFFYKGLPAMWVLPAMHWLFIAFSSVGLACHKSNSCSAILKAFGVLILIDAVINFMHVGPFAGVYMLGLTGALLLASGLMTRKDMRD